MTRCPHCGQTHGPDSHFCGVTGQPLDLGPRLLGQVLFGRYEVRNLVGEGPFAVVLRAADLQEGVQDVAIKMLHPQFAGDAAATDRYLAEARRAGELGHPNLAAVHATGRDPGGAPTVVREFFTGVNLARYVRDRGPLAADAACHVLASVLSALRAAHETGLVNGDLAPDDVFLTRGPAGEMAVKLLDFGEAHLKQALVASGRADARVTRFWAPEQVRSGIVDEHSDVFAAGAILYLAVTGRPPYPDGIPPAPQAIPMPPNPSALRPDLNRKLDILFRRATALLPSDRYATAAAFAEAVAPFLPACPPPFDWDERASAPGPVPLPAGFVPGKPPSTAPAQPAERPAAAKLPLHKATLIGAPAVRPVAVPPGPPPAPPVPAAARAAGAPPAAPAAAKPPLYKATLIGAPATVPVIPPPGMGPRAEAAPADVGKPPAAAPPPEAAPADAGKPLAAAPRADLAMARTLVAPPAAPPPPSFATSPPPAPAPSAAPRAAVRPSVLTEPPRAAQARAKTIGIVVGALAVVGAIVVLVVVASTGGGAATKRDGAPAIAAAQDAKATPARDAAPAPAADAGATPAADVAAGPPEVAAPDVSAAGQGPVDAGAPEPEAGAQDAGPPDEAAAVDEVVALDDVLVDTAPDAEAAPPDFGPEAPPPREAAAPDAAPPDVGADVRDARRAHDVAPEVRPVDAARREAAPPRDAAPRDAGVREAAPPADRARPRDAGAAGQDGRRGILRDIGI
jgi:serine/threonine-protein kinase